MARDYFIRSKGGLDPAVDGNFAISGTQTVDGPSTLTGAVTAGAALTATTYLKDTTGYFCTPAAISANGTLAGLGCYVFNGADGAIHLPLVASYNGAVVRVFNMNGTGTATLTANATDSAAIVGNADSAGTFLLTPYTGITLVAYAAGTVWGVTGQT